MSLNKKKTTTFLLLSLLLLIAVTTVVMLVFVISMGNKSQQVINDVGDIYMQGMSEKIATHFETTISLRTGPLETMMKNNPPDSYTGGDEDIGKLRYEAEIRNYEYLALLDRQGDFHMILGADVELEDPEPFMRSIFEGEDKVAVGHSVNEDKIVMMAIPAEYPLGDGTKSVALVAGIPAQYINDILSLDESEGITYSHIIRRNGTFVIRNSGKDLSEDYFSMLRHEYDGDGAEDFISDLRQAMEQDTDFSSVLPTAKGRRHIYCTPLPHSEWYLVTVLPFGVLDETINGLDQTRTTLFFFTIGVVLLVLCGVFFAYFRMSQKQMKMLDEARREAEKATKAKSEFLSNMSV